MKSLGRQILAELYGCRATLLDDVIELEARMVRAALDAGATVINTGFHRFSPYGVSGVVVIQESHLSIHTWPEHGFAAVDVFTCGEEVDPAAACRSIAEALEAERCETREIDRGPADRLDPVPDQHAPTPASPGGPDAPSSYVRNIWFTEKGDDIALSLRHAGALFRKQSSIQRVEVLNTHRYGRLLVLDGTVAFSERDEYVYHEMIVHPAALTHAGIRRALVIGGGDGGACREILRHPTVASVAVVEIDPVVVAACRAHFPDVARSLSDPRVDLRVGDGIAFLDGVDDASLDLIVVDAGGTSGPGEPLSTPGFYRQAKRCLAPGGILCAQAPRPTLDSESFRAAFRNLGEAFGAGNVRCFLAFIPSFTTGLVSFSFASPDGLRPQDGVSPERLQSLKEPHILRYYTPEIHTAAFTLPGFIQAMLSDAG